LLLQLLLGTALWVLQLLVWGLVVKAMLLWLVVVSRVVGMVVQV
jgi:hypothetical protein